MKDFEISEFYERQGDLYRSSGDTQKALELYEKARETFERLCEAEPPRSELTEAFSALCNKIRDTYRSLGPYADLFGGMRVEHPSFERFVYPFLFEPPAFDLMAEKADKAKYNQCFIWTKEQFPGEDLLSHVSEYLNPPRRKPATALLWTMRNNDALQCFLGLGDRSYWSLLHHHGEVPFRIREVQLALFRSGVGFLTVEIAPKSGVLGDWLDFLHYFRLARGQRDIRVRAQQPGGQGQYKPFFPPLAGGVESHPNGEGVFGDVLDAVLRRTVGVEHPQEVFVPGRLIPYAVLYLDDQGQGTNDRRVGELLYRVRNFIHSTHEIRPSANDLLLDNTAVLSYGDKIWFTFSLEGSAFVAINAPQRYFFLVTLPSYLRDQYFLLFLMALHQRFTLMRLSQQVSEHWLAGCKADRAVAFEQIRNDLLEFTARGYFVQVVQRDQHHRVYRKWQEVFQLDDLYREVSDEVREMHECLVSEQARRLERRLNRLGAFIGVPALVIGFLGINICGVTAVGEGLPFWPALLLCAGLGGVLGALVLWLLGRM